MKKIVVITFLIVALIILGVVLYYKNTRYYFAFDEVVYYKSKSDKDFISWEEGKSNTLRDSMVQALMGDYDYEFVPFTRAVAYLDSLGFEKKIIPVSKHEVINEIFREKIDIDLTTVTCLPVYRDIYVFKRGGQLAGVARLCYDCWQSSFYGTRADTECFGTDGEFEKLHKIVK